jgi:tRNA (guanine-N7-)-methyltransferase
MSDGPDHNPSKDGPSKDGHPKRRLYGRAAGKPLSKTQTARVETLLPKLAIPEGKLAPLALFGGSAREVWLEIGFGGGEHLAGQAASRSSSPTWRAS